MASAMKKAVEAGREAYLAGRMAKKIYQASPPPPRRSDRLLTLIARED
jgi:thiazole synthase